MRDNATYRELAAVHNRICDAKTMTNRVIGDGASPLEKNQLLHALHDLEQARKAVDQALRHHPKWKAGVGG